jgi:fucose 4-O-acetylase-like acetyltransferase
LNDQLLGLAGRAIIYVLASIFGIFIIAFFPSGKSYITKIGQRSLVIYLGHGFLNGIVRLTNPFVDLPTINTIFLFAFSIFVTWFLSLSIFDKLYRQVMHRINGFLAKIFVRHQEETGQV